MRNNQRQVAITGIGIISALGGSIEETYTSLREGKTGIKMSNPFSLPDYDMMLGVVSEDTLARACDKYNIKGEDNSELFLLCSLEEAIENAGLKDYDNKGCLLNQERMGVIIGTILGGIQSYELFLGGSVDTQRLRSYPLFVLTQKVADRAGCRGKRQTVSTACSSSTIAIGLAYEEIRRGQADIVIAGGVDTLSRLTITGFESLQASSRELCRPFDKNRQGLNLGEGAAVLILEELSHAKRRKCPHIYAEVCGFGSRADAVHITAPDRFGRGLTATIREALLDAALDITEIDYINMHGTATQYNDAMEITAIMNIFGELAHSIPLTSTKSLTGHCLGAAGAIEAVISVLSLWHGFIPPTVNFHEPDDGLEIAVAKTCICRELNTCMSLNAGFGGNNAAIILKKYTGE